MDGGERQAGQRIAVVGLLQPLGVVADVGEVARGQIEGQRPLEQEGVFRVGQQCFGEIVGRGGVVRLLAGEAAGILVGAGGAGLAAG